MALIIEDGSIVSGANSYATVSGANAYFTALGDTRWTTGRTDTQREQAILKGMKYIEGLNWKGTTVSGTQPLQFPRTGLTDRDGRDVDEDTVPNVVIKALYEASVRAISGEDLLPDLPRGGRVSAEQVGSISRAYSTTAPAGTVFTSIKVLLRGMLKGADNVNIVRA